MCVCQAGAWCQVTWLFVRAGCAQRVCVCVSHSVRVLRGTRVYRGLHVDLYIQVCQWVWVRMGACMALCVGIYVYEPM